MSVIKPQMKGRKNIVKKVKKGERVRYHGLIKINPDSAFNFISNEDKNGWSLGLILKAHTAWLTNVRFVSKKEVLAIVKNNRVVFFPKKKAAK